MSLPAQPPASEEPWKDQERFKRILEAISSMRPPSYWHWDELRHRPAPEGLSHEDWWVGVKVFRRTAYRTIPYLDRRGNPFVLGASDRMHEALHRIDLAMGGRFADPTSPEDRDRYVINTLIEESITSSQIEGASTTRQVAADMLRRGRAPVDKSERMIVNNYHAMRFIREHRDTPLTPDLVLELHRILSTGTLDNARDEGRLQQPGEERVVVQDNRDGTVLHTPPDASELPHRLRALCAFANGKTEPAGYLHPVVRAILLHFFLAYDHPFQDGNGRTARALFYWGLLHEEYRLAEFISISKQIRASQGQYRRAFLHSETDDNDLTYFVLNQLEVLLKALDELGRYLERKADDLRKLERKLRIHDSLNHRQKALLAHALRHPRHSYSIESHRASHGVVYATARSDLLRLAQLGLLLQGKSGHALHFIAPPDLEARLQRERDE